MLDKTEMASAVWADTRYRSAANEDYLEKHGFISRIHCKKSQVRPMSETMRRANAVKSKVRSCVDHVFAVQKARMVLFVRTIDIARATTRYVRALGSAYQYVSDPGNRDEVATIISETTGAPRDIAEKILMSCFEPFNGSMPEAPKSTWMEWPPSSS